MTDSIGSRFWKRAPAKSPITNPDILRKCCIEYFDWAHESPLQEAKAFAYQGDSWIERVDKARAFSLKGLVTFIGLTEGQWDELKKQVKMNPICEWAETVIYQQKFELAAGDLLNANFIARDLGLAEKVDQKGSVNLIISQDDANL